MCKILICGVLEHTSGYVQTIFPLVRALTKDAAIARAKEYQTKYGTYFEQ